MASEEVQLAWKLSIAGAEEIKQKLAEVHQQFNRGEITVEQYSKELSKNASIARNLTQQNQLANRVWLAQHPTINQLSRTLSGLNRVLSVTSAAMTAINTAQLLMRTNTGNLIELQNGLAEAERAYNTALTPEAKEEAARQMAEYAARIEEANKQMGQDAINNAFSFASSIGSIATAVGVFLTKSGGSIAARLAPIISFFSRLAFIGFNASTALSAVSGAFAALGPAIAIAAGAIAGFFIADWLNENTVWYHQYALALTDLFFNKIPTAINEGIDWLTRFATGDAIIWSGIVIFLTNTWLAITTGFAGFWEGMKNLAAAGADSIVKTVSSMVDRIISAVKKALEWLAKLPGDVAKGIGDFFSGGSNKSSRSGGVKKGAAGLSFIADSPITFQAGEAGTKEKVTIQPLGIGGSSPSGGLTIINHNYIEGSIHAERDLEEVLDRYGIREARRRGWRG